MQVFMKSVSMHNKVHVAKVTIDMVLAQLGSYDCEDAVKTSSAILEIQKLRNHVQLQTISNIVGDSGPNTSSSWLA